MGTKEEILSIIRENRREIRNIFLSDNEILRELKELLLEVILQELKTLNQKMDKLGQIIEKHGEAINRLEVRMDRLEQQVAKNTEAIKELRTEVDELKVQVAKNTEAIKELRTEMDELKTQVTKNTEAVKELRTEVNELKIQVSKNTEAIKELTGYMKQFLHILQEASGMKTEEDLRAFLDAAVYDFGLRVEKYKTASGHDVDILIMDSKVKAIEIKRTAYDQDVMKFLQVVEELMEEFPNRKMLKPLVVCNVDKIKDPALRKQVEVIEFADIWRIPVSSRRIKKIQEKLKKTDLYDRIRDHKEES